MNRNLKQLVISLLFLASAIGEDLNAADWKRLGPDAADVASMTCSSDGTQLMVGTSYGLFVSDDGGASWTKATGLEGEAFALETVSDGAIAFVSVDRARGADAVFESVDAGATWMDVNLDGTGRVTVDHHDPDTIYVAGFQVGVLRSTDHGDSWEQLGSFLGRAGLNVTVDPVDPTRLYVGTSYLAYWSEDSGQSWQTSQMVRGWEAAFEILPWSGDTFFARGGRGIIRSDDRGETWSIAEGQDNIYRASDLLVDPASGDLYLAALDGALFRSTNGSGTWTALESPGLVKNLCLSGDGSALFAGTAGQGVFLWGDGAKSWSPASSIPSSNTTAVAVTNEGVVIAGNAEGIFRRSPSGGWTHVLDGMLIHELMTEPANPEVIYASVERGIMKSADHGVTWRRIEFFSGGHVLDLASGPGGVVYAASSPGSFRSNDQGETWEKISTSGPEYSIAVDPFNSERLLLGDIRRIELSEDGGQTWKTKVDDLASGANALMFSRHSEGTLFAGTNDGRILRSDDDGESWSTVLTNLGLVLEIMDRPDNPSGVWAATRSGLYESVDGGWTWEPIESGLPNSAVNGLAVAGARFFAATSDGIYVEGGSDRRRAVRRP